MHNPYTSAIFLLMLPRILFLYAIKDLIDILLSVADNLPPRPAGTPPWEGNKSMLIPKRIFVTALIDDADFVVKSLCGPISRN